MMITSEESSLLLELVQEYDYPDFDPDKHVTANMLAEKLSLSHRAAYERLERLRAKGALTRERIRLPGNCRAWGYYKPEDKTE